MKYEEIYLYDYTDGIEARRGLDRYFRFYNTERQPIGTSVGIDMRSAASPSGWHGKENKYGSGALAYLAAKTVQTMGVSSVMDFSERLVLNAPNLWAKGNLKQRQKLQQLLSPGKITYLNNVFEPTVTCLLYNDLQATISELSNVG